MPCFCLEARVWIICLLACFHCWIPVLGRFFATTLCCYGDGMWHVYVLYSRKVWYSWELPQYVFFSKVHIILLYSQRQTESIDLDLSDDEELKEALDVHAIVSPMVPRSTEEDINADDVINEIDTIMKVLYCLIIFTLQDLLLTYWYHSLSSFWWLDYSKAIWSLYGFGLLHSSGVIFGIGRLSMWNLFSSPMFCRPYHQFQTELPKLLHKDCGWFPLCKTVLAKSAKGLVLDHNEGKWME